MVFFFIPNRGDPDQMPHFAASDLGLRCLPMSHKKDTRLIQVNYATKSAKRVFLSDNEIII